jgi:hypothetical protein
VAAPAGSTTTFIRSATNGPRPGSSASGSRDDLVDQVAEEGEGEGAGEGGAEAVGDRAGDDRDRAAGGQGGGQGGGALGLDRDHPAVGVGVPHGQGGAAGEAAAPDAHHPDVDRAGVLDQLQGDGALAGDDLGVVEGVDEGEAALALEPLALGERLGGGVAVQDHLGAVAPAGGHLGGGAVGRHDHGRLGPGLGRRPGHGGAVVAGGDAHQPPLAGLVGQGELAVEGAAGLERARLLDRLVLDQDLGAGAPVESGRGAHRGPVHLTGDPRRCGPHR